ncbi:S66 peptidase family protein [Piscirickettsia salmonis]|uniref:S66 peptidase family protein n=1 Tax=Piscirickettsia salmonis TaxID=1238 RepID=UPI0009B76AC5|nr:LD-carboxypeptidase [Piscirickettsia salmonis]PEQ15791.1 LD-carboxypeptidase [Piscirickettsia salmonis]WGZ71834.1 LD-carboxypeptidase [Piscirickettsia salmonis EM-90]
MKPSHLEHGDTVALISSASRAPTNQSIEFAKERLEALGLNVILGNHVYSRDGYFAGTDVQRVDDLNQAFSNPKVKGIFEVRGGWGSSRILPLIDYNNIKKHPKILIGFSDITSLLLAINKKTGLETFHGTMGIQRWPEFTVEYMKKVLFDGSKVVFENPRPKPDPTVDLILTKDRIEVIHEGVASGPLIGGNLSVLVALLGTEYEPSWQGKILFVEDVDEKNYRIDRLLSQLELAGVFKEIKGFIFGKCTRCEMATGSDGAKTLREIVEHYVASRNIPTFMGSMIGHIPENFTLPEGLPVIMNANNGTIKMLEPAVI